MYGWTLLVSCYNIGKKRNMKAINLYSLSLSLSLESSLLYGVYAHSLQKKREFCHPSFLIKYLILHFFFPLSNTREKNFIKFFHFLLFVICTRRRIMKTSSNIQTSCVTSSEFCSSLFFYNLLSSIWRKEGYF